MPYREWPKADKDAMLVDIKRWAVSNVPVKTWGGKEEEPLTTSLWRLGRIEATLGAQQSLLKALLADSKVDVDALATALAPLLVGSMDLEQSKLTTEELTAATEAGVRQAFSNL